MSKEPGALHEEGSDGQGRGIDNSKTATRGDARPGPRRPGRRGRPSTPCLRPVRGASLPGSPDRHRGSAGPRCSADSFGGLGGRSLDGRPLFSCHIPPGANRMRRSTLEIARQAPRPGCRHPPSGLEPPREQRAGQASRRGGRQSRTLKALFAPLSSDGHLPRQRPLQAQQGEKRRVHTLWVRRRSRKVPHPERPHEEHFPERRHPVPDGLPDAVVPKDPCRPAPATSNPPATPLRTAGASA